MSVFHNNALIGAGGGAAAAASGGATKSLRFNEEHSSYLHRTPSSAGNRTTWTWSCWFKRGKNSNYSQLFNASTAVNNYTQIYIESDDTFVIASNTTAGGNRYLVSTRLLRDPSAWYHLVAVFDTTNSTQADRMRLYVNNERVTDFSLSSLIGQNVESNINSTNQHSIGSVQPLGTNGRLDGYLANVYFVDGSALDPTSFGAYDDNGVWQAAAYSGTFGTNGFHLLDFENESTIGHDSSGNENDFTAVNFLAAQNQYLGDITGTQRSGFNWVQMFDGDLNNGAVPAISSSFTFSPSPTIPFTTLQVYAYKDTSPGTLKINGTDVSSQIPNHNGVGPNQLTTISGITSPLTSIQNISNGSLANVVLAGVVIDGELLLDKASEVDILFDVPTNGDQSDTGAGGEVSGNYCTISPLSIPSQSVTVSNGNLDHTGAGTNVARVGTIAIPSSGKWYWEVTCNKGGSGAWLLGINGDTMSQALRLAYVSDARKYTDAGGGFSSYGASFTSGDVIGVAVDMDADTLTFYKNGSTQGTAFTSISSGYSNIFPYFQTEHSGRSLSVNFGQRAWAYSAPSNHKALCTTNLPTATVPDGSEYFNTVLYSGNATARSITTGHSSDFVWIKMRNSGNNHFLFDSVRGVGRRLMTSGNNDEDGNSSTDTLTSFNSDGFSLGADTATGGVNANSVNLVAWSWDAGSSTVTNTDGDITSQVRASQTAGISIVTYTGPSSAGFQSVGHGLNAKPYFIISKDRDNARNWGIYHQDAQISDVRVLGFLTNGTFNSATATWDVSAIDNSTFTPYFRDDFGSSFNADNVAYCFAPVSGFSSFGTFEGTSSFEGAHIYMGFRPAFFMWKNIDSDGFNWGIIDSTRGPYNFLSRTLNPNNTNTESSRTALDAFDFLSNGVKVRATGSNARNQSGSTFIYAAFAENPFQANGGLAR